MKWFCLSSNFLTNHSGQVRLWVVTWYRDRCGLEFVMLNYVPKHPISSCACHVTFLSVCSELYGVELSLSIICSWYILATTYAARKYYHAENQCSAEGNDTNNSSSSKHAVCHYQFWRNIIHENHVKYGVPQILQATYTGQETVN